jgi:hypothetical protein
MRSGTPHQAQKLDKPDPDKTAIRHTELFDNSQVRLEVQTYPLYFEDFGAFQGGEGIPDT